MHRFMSVLAGCVLAASATAGPPGVKLFVEAEVTGVVREEKGVFFVETDPSDEEKQESEKWGELNPKFRDMKDKEAARQRWWRLDTEKTKLTKDDLQKLVGKRVEVVGRSPLRIVTGGVPGRDPFSGRDNLEVSHELRVSEMREVGGK